MKANWIKTVTNDTLNIVTDPVFCEQTIHGSEEFPFQCYKEQLEWNHAVCVDWHWHEEWELILIDEGKMECWVDEQSVCVEAGEGILLNSFAIHRFQPPKDSHAISCRFTAIMFRLKMLAPIESAIYQHTIRPVADCGMNCLFLNTETLWQKHILQLAQQIRQECEHPGVTSEMSVHIKLCCIMEQLMQHVDELPKASESRQDIVMRSRMRKMLQFIWENYRKQITTKDIAQAANISKSTAQRCFRICIQDNPTHYLQSYRLNQAKQRLLATDKSILEIALSTGFESVGYFDRLFRREFGIAPRQFIQQEKEWH